jgi:hypothetical protein
MFSRRPAAGDRGAGAEDADALAIRATTSHGDITARSL